MGQRSWTRSCIKCSVGLPKGSRSKGLCRSCYLRQREESRSMATCHPEERLFGKGFCKKCYYKANPMSPETQRACYLRKAYGLSPEDVVKKVEWQDNKCAICQKEFIQDADINIDHCHTTGQVRGVLCRWCNIGLGNFQDNIGLLHEAIDYLSRYNIVKSDSVRDAMARLEDYRRGSNEQKPVYCLAPGTSRQPNYPGLGSGNRDVGRGNRVCV